MKNFQWTCEDQIRMIEEYEGSVEHVHDDGITVVYETDNDIIEHQYNRNQIIGPLPKVGDRFKVCVIVTQIKDTRNKKGN